MDPPFLFLSTCSNPNAMVLPFSRTCSCSSALEAAPEAPENLRLPRSLVASLLLTRMLPKRLTYLPALPARSRPHKPSTAIYSADEVRIPSGLGRHRQQPRRRPRTRRGNERRASENRPQRELVSLSNLQAKALVFPCFDSHARTTVAAAPPSQG